MTGFNLILSEKHRQEKHMEHMRIQLNRRGAIHVYIPKNLAKTLGINSRRKQELTFEKVAEQDNVYRISVIEWGQREEPPEAQKC